MENISASAEIIHENFIAEIIIRLADFELAPFFRFNYNGFATHMLNKTDAGRKFNRHHGWKGEDHLLRLIRENQVVRLSAEKSDIIHKNMPLNISDPFAISKPQFVYAERRNPAFVRARR
jgi:hypothetical protein